jgi:pimeloyl-ACP methyl ester carboxylesterase
VLSHPVSEQVLQWSQNLAMQASLKATLIIHGTGDKTVPIDAAGRAAAKGIANSTLIEFEGAPHCLFASHKERFIGDVLSFLGNSRPRAKPQLEPCAPGITAQLQ